MLKSLEEVNANWLQGLYWSRLEHFSPAMNLGAALKTFLFAATRAQDPTYPDGEICEDPTQPDHFDIDSKIDKILRSTINTNINSIATFKGDLHSLTAPPFLLSPQSMTEFSTYWCERPSLFVAPAHEPDPEKRILLVLKWFISTLKEQHCNQDANGKTKKLKPLNPFLGEIFKGKWEDGVGVTNMVSEQVSHHPPVTAYCIWNKEHGIKLHGHVAPKVYFSSTINIERKGYSILHIDKYDEDYIITMPKVHVEGLMSGSLFLELSGSSYIRSSSGYTIKIDYSENPLYTAKGQWSDSYVLEEAGSNEEVEKVEIDQVSRTPLSIAPLEQQDPLESRRAWQHVVAAINKGDIFAVGHEKSKIEMQQREMRKQEKLTGAEFSRRYFTHAEKDVVAERLVKGARDEDVIRNEMAVSSHGVWLASNKKMPGFE